MNSKLLILVLLGFSILFFGCAKQAPQEDEMDHDVLGPEGEPPSGDTTEKDEADAPEEEVMPPADAPDEDEAPVDDITEEPEEETPGEDTAEDEAVEENESEEETVPDEEDVKEQERLADLFNIDTEQPLGDDGLDSDGPSSDSS